MFDDFTIDRQELQASLVARLPRPLDDEESARLEHLIADAIEALAVEFDDAGRDLAAELAADYNSRLKPLHVKVQWGVREMVSAAVLIGPNAGMRTVSSSTGAQSDSATFTDVDSVSWSGIKVTDQIRQRLGLAAGARPLGRFPRPLRWPEVVHRVRPGF